MSDYDYEQPSVYDERHPVAAKAHVCCECGGEIPKGQRYQYVKGCWDGTWSKFRTCEMCEDQRDEYHAEVGEPPPFTMLREWCYNSDIEFWPLRRAGGAR